MARERKTHAQQEDVRTDVGKPVAHASEPSSLANEAATPHPELSALVKLIARHAAREDARALERDTHRKVDQGD